MNGLVYLLDQAGSALAQANQRIGELEAENTALRDQITGNQSGEQPSP